jgi:hypothetical protein
VAEDEHIVSVALLKQDSEEETEDAELAEAINAEINEGDPNVAEVPVEE